MPERAPRDLTLRDLSWGLAGVIERVLLWGALPIAVIGGLLFAAVRVVPPLLVDDRGLTPVERVQAVNDARSPTVAAFAGLGLLLGALVTALTYRQTRVRDRSTEALAREEQRTDRYTRAVELLGHTNPNVRIGGVDALARLGRESYAEGAVAQEVLISFARQAARPTVGRPSAR